MYSRGILISPEVGPMELWNSAKYLWKLKEQPVSSDVESLAKDAGLSHLVAGLLWQRGHRDFDQLRKFFRPGFEYLHDPFRMKDMDEAVNLLSEALHIGQKVLVYGDYDVDGTTSVAMMASFLEVLGVEVEVYIPDRYKEGYGVSLEGMQFAVDKGIELIITLDCGIRATESISFAREAGISVIVCDHHQPGDELPPANAILDPMRADCDYPFKGLSGCGVGFKLIQAFCMQQSIDEKIAWSFLDLLTISTAADIVPMVDENRVFCYYGLQMLNGESLRPGIASLLDKAGVKPGRLTIEDVVFTLAPRINAAGRMSHGSKAVELLRSRDKHLTDILAIELDELNKQRRHQDTLITAQAMDQLEDSWEHPASIVFDPGWHKGVIGIVASRLIDKYFRPTIVLTGADDYLTGSARSVPGFDLHKGLEACSSVLEKYGGHTMAAGVTLHKDKLEDFKQLFHEVVMEHRGTVPDQPVLEIDAMLQPEVLKMEDYRHLRRMAPFGPFNMNPVFACEAVIPVSDGRAIGQGNAHLSFRVAGPGGAGINCVGFQLGEYHELVRKGEPLHLAFTMHENFWNGKVSLQLQIRDLIKA